MNRKNITEISNVFDIYGVKIIVNTEIECYMALGLLHKNWKPLSSRFKDYIAVPKQNGYQSLHTTLLGVSDSRFPTEVQIKTEQMNLDADSGPAAHWMYKESKSGDFGTKYKDQVTSLPSDIQDLEINSFGSEQFKLNAESDILSAKVHVFTPEGDIKTLPQGSCPIDFAFLVHTDIGKSCVGARINGEIKPLDYELLNGDVIEIVTKKNRTPNPLWLNLVKTSGAKQKIKAILKAEGASYLISEKNSQMKPQKKREEKAPVLSLNYEIIIGGERGMPYRISGKCCTPTLDSSIVAFNTLSSGFSIHLSTCPEVKLLEKEKLKEAHFGIIKKFHIEATSRQRLFKDVSSLVSDCGLFLWDTKIKRKPGRKVEWMLLLEGGTPHHFEHFQDIILSVKNVEDIKEKTIRKKKIET